MSRDLSDLNQDFRPKVEELLLYCSDKGYTLVPYFTVRDVWEQARLWRQSRFWVEIKKAIVDLKVAEAYWIAEVLEGVGPQYGRWATDALPGESWHQYGAAVDCFVLENKQAVWNPTHKGYAVYAAGAIKLGLGCGYYWRYPNPYHVQQFQQSVTSSTSWSVINDMMYKKYYGWRKRQEENIGG